MKTIKYSLSRGQTLVEFALILPAFLLLAVVLFDFGRGVYYYSAIHNAAREGARYGAANPMYASGTVSADAAGMRARVKNYAVGLGLNDANITFANLDPSSYESAAGFSNPTVRVSVTFDFYPATPFVTQIICACSSGFLTLNSDAIMRTEWIPSP
jgi:Flp pilus assembly protein TadG